MAKNSRSIKWKDAADRTDVALKDIKDNPTTNWMSHRESYGKIIKEDEFGIVLLTDIDENDDCEITVIPKQWIEEVDNV